MSINHHMMSNTFSGEDEEEEEISAPDDFEEAGCSDPQQEEEQVQYSTVQYCTVLYSTAAATLNESHITYFFMLQEEPSKQASSSVTKPKSHECKKCKKVFSKVSLLNRHMKLHLGIKPFQCNVSLIENMCRNGIIIMFMTLVTDLWLEVSAELQPEEAHSDSRQQVPEMQSM